MSDAINDLRLPLKAVSALLGYPDAALQAHAREVAGVLTARAELNAVDREMVAGFADWLTDSDLLEVQGSYVETFDRSKKVSLYLFEHLYGESRDRGPAMIELGNAYREHGLAIDRRELPDFLPLFLEFNAELPEAEALAWLEEVGPVLQQVHVRLADRESPFAAPLRALLRLAGFEPAPAELARAASEEERDDTPAALDRIWREAPVTFGPDQPQIACGAPRQQSVEKPVRWMDNRRQLRRPE